RDVSPVHHAPLRLFAPAGTISTVNISRLDIVVKRPIRRVPLSTVGGWCGSMSKTPCGKEPTMLSLNSIMIGTEDTKVLNDFYAKVLGKPTWEDSGYVGWQVGSSNLMIGPHSEVKGRNEMPGRIIL